MSDRTVRPFYFALGLGIAALGFELYRMHRGEQRLVMRSPASVRGATLVRVDRARDREVAEPLLEGSGRAVLWLTRRLGDVSRARRLGERQMLVHAWGIAPPVDDGCHGGSICARRAGVNAPRVAIGCWNGVAAVSHLAMVVTTESRPS